jgi:hypothetical protein
MSGRHQLGAVGAYQVRAVVPIEGERGAVGRARLGQSLELLQKTSVIRPY